MSYFLKVNNAYNTQSFQEIDRYEIKQNILNGFEDTIDFYPVTINGENQDLLIIHLSEGKSVSTNLLDKRIKSRPDETFNMGDIVVWENNNWLITEVDSDRQLYTKGIMVQCNYIIKFQDSDGNILSYPVVFESNSGTLQYNNMITTVQGSSRIKCRFDSLLANLLVSGKRLMIDSRVGIDIPNCYKISLVTLQSYDSTNGILNINLEKDTFNATADRKDLGICDYKTITPSTGTAQITFSGNAEVKTGGSYKSFVFLCKDASGTVLNLTPVWTLTSSTGSIINFTYVKDDTNQTIKIKVADISSMIGTTLILSVVAQTDSTYLSNLTIKVVSL